MALSSQFEVRAVRRYCLMRFPLPAFAMFLLTLPSIAQNQAPQPPQQQQKAPAPMQDAPDDGLPRGKKLMLKDGTFQLVREYQLDGDRVRYYSIDQRDWQEIPAALVDWDATKKVEGED